MSDIPTHITASVPPVSPSPPNYIFKSTCSTYSTHTCMLILLYTDFTCLALELKTTKQPFGLRVQHSCYNSPCPRFLVYVAHHIHPDFSLFVVRGAIFLHQKRIKTTTRSAFSRLGSVTLLPDDSTPNTENCRTQGQG